MGPQPVRSQQVQHVVPGQPLQHAQQHAFRVEVPDLAARTDDDFVQLVRVDVVIPDDMSHDVADAVPVACRDHGALHGGMYVNRHEASTGCILLDGGPAGLPAAPPACYPARSLSSRSRTSAYSRRQSSGSVW